MKIVIIGDGKVGYKLAKQLSEDNYDVVLIDNNAGKLKAATNKLDIICITGDGVSAEVQREADVPHADLVIACASTDELNMLSCLIARRLGAYDCQSSQPDLLSTDRYFERRFEAEYGGESRTGSCE